MTLTQFNLSPVSISAIPLFNYQFSELINLFFCTNECSLIHSTLSEMLINATTDDIAQFRECSDFFTELISIYGTTRWCAHLTHIVIVLNEFGFNGPKNNESKWQAFARDAVPAFKRILDQDYGGPLPIDDETQQFNTEGDSYE